MLYQYCIGRGIKIFTMRDFVFFEMNIRCENLGNKISSSIILSSSRHERKQLIIEKWIRFHLHRFVQKERNGCLREI